MREGAPALLTVTAALVAGLVLAPPAAAVGRPGRADGHQPRHRSGSHRHFRHGHFHRPIVPFTTFWSPLLVYAPPPWFYSPPAYPDPPVVYNPPPVYDPPPAYPRAVGYGRAVSGSVTVAQAPTPGVIEYPTGRYELRGDGMATPYTWVWIPNPPPPPPPGPPPDVSPPAAPASSVDRAPATRRSELYRWTDEQGVEHWTDRRDRVPEQYRPRAKRPDPS